MAAKMVPVTCCHEKCGITFAMAELFNQALRRSHELFYCPRGHSQAYRGKSDVEILQEALKNKEWQLTNANDATARARKERWEENAKLKCLRTRVKKGRCPASRRCKARFEDLQRHLKSHHPHHPWRTK